MQEQMTMLKTRSRQAGDLLKRIDKLLSGIMKLPSFKGKAPLYDKINRIRMDAHNLNWDFKRDIEDFERATRRK
jgi:hypothetical protein